MKQKDKNIQVQ